MKLLESNSYGESKRLSWVSVLNAIVQALIAALTALGVSSCVSAMR